MEKQFEEISSMLDKVVGGKNLFNVDTAVNDREICNKNCTTNCSGMGTVSGETRGTIFPDTFEEK